VKFPEHPVPDHRITAEDGCIMTLTCPLPLAFPSPDAGFSVIKCLAHRYHHLSEVWPRSSILLLPRCGHSICLDEGDYARQLPSNGQCRQKENKQLDTIGEKSAVMILRRSAISSRDLASPWKLLEIRTSKGVLMDRGFVFLEGKKKSRQHDEHGERTKAKKKKNNLVFDSWCIIYIPCE
jgi:hypothetical protein